MLRYIILQIISEENITEEYKKMHPDDIVDGPMFQVVVKSTCYGKVETLKRIWTQNQYNRYIQQRFWYE